MSRLIWFLVVGLLTAGLLAAAYAFAWVDASADGPAAFARLLDANSLAVVILLLTPTFVLFLLQRRGQGPAPAWQWLWTAGLVAFLVHLGWTNWVCLPGSPADPVVGPGEARLAVVIAVWWALDALLSWATLSWRSIRVWRGVLHLVLFAGLFWGAVIRGERALRLARRGHGSGRAPRGRGTHRPSSLRPEHAFGPPLHGDVPPAQHLPALGSIPHLAGRRQSGRLARRSACEQPSRHLGDSGDQFGWGRSHSTFRPPVFQRARARWTLQRPRQADDGSREPQPGRPGQEHGVHPEPPKRPFRPQCAGGGSLP